MKKPPKPRQRHQQSLESKRRECLVGKIVYAAWGLTMQLNSFAIVLKETAKTAYLTPLAVARNESSLDRGTERPLLVDGQIAIKNLINVSRITTTEYGAPLIARLRFDPKYFDRIARHDAIQAAGDPPPGEAVVHAIRLNKVVDESGSLYRPQPPG